MVPGAALTKLRNIVGLARRTLFGRPGWTAQSEYAYYAASEAAVLAHRMRQAQFAVSGDSLGRRLVGDMGVADALPGATVLDIGAGEGVLSVGMIRRGAADVWALDAVPKQIWAAAERAPRGLHCCIADARDLPFEANVFDLVTAHLMLHHIEPLGPVLSEVFRVLKPGGRFVALEPTPLVGALTHQVLSANEAPISPAYVKRELMNAGFSGWALDYHWSRLQTSILGPLSPGYRASVMKPLTAVLPPCAASILRRPLEPLPLKGLQLDAACSFAEMAREQAAYIERSLKKV